MLQLTSHFRLRRLSKQVWQRLNLYLAVLLLSLVSAISPLYAQDTTTQGNAVDGYPVTLGSETLFTVREGVLGVVSAQERAEIVSDRLLEVAQNTKLSVDQIEVETTGDLDVVQLNNTVLFTILEADRKSVELSADLSRSEIGQKVVGIFRDAIQTYRQERSLRQLLLGVLFAILSTIIVIVLLRLTFVFAGIVIHKVDALGERRRSQAHWRYRNVFGPYWLRYLFVQIIRLMRLGVIFGILYLYLPFVLSQFPITKPFGDSIFQRLGQQFDQFVTGFASYLPNLMSLVILGLFTYYLLGGVRQIIVELGREDAYPWFYPEWIRPTIRLVTFLMIVIACVIGSPYLPGFGSPAFQGVSIFVGALITLGSSSTVANAVSGIILIYTRAFQLQDVIQIEDIFGKVDEKSLFVTRILTPNQEVITVPNTTVLNSNLTNYSAIAREPDRHLLLHTTITLGYDVPWRQVHEVLINAAKATANIMAEPSPFVLQTSLNDFNVSYELKVCTRFPERMAQIYSDLHQNIQDYCNEAEIEILSPTFAALRDGNHSTIPEGYLPKDYAPPAFRFARQLSDRESLQSNRPLA